MRGMTSAAGGMVAAATTSLPERAVAGRNYDCRYAWIRDQCYAGSAVAAVGGHPLLDQAVTFVSTQLHADGPDLAPAYTASGGRVPDQARLRLPGYPGGFDQTGNWVNKQFQLDALGEALLLFADAARLDRLDADAAAAARIAAAAIEQRWQEPDAGIWELDEQPWTHSRLICAAGLRAARCGHCLRSRRTRDPAGRLGRRDRGRHFSARSALLGPVAAIARPTRRAPSQRFTLHPDPSWQCSASRARMMVTIWGVGYLNQHGTPRSSQSHHLVERQDGIPLNRIQ